VVSTVVGKSTQFRIPQQWLNLVGVVKPTIVDYKNVATQERHLHLPVLLVRHLGKNLEVPNHLMDLEEY